MHLIEQARELRAIAHDLVEQRKDDLCRIGSVERLNAFLREYQRNQVLRCSNADGVHFVWQSTSSFRAQLFGAVAEAAARLLAEADFKLVRKCEDRECMMWFYDLAKAGDAAWPCAATETKWRHIGSAIPPRLDSTGQASFPAGDSTGFRMPEC